MPPFLSKLTLRRGSRWFWRAALVVLAPMGASAAPVEATLNGLKISIDGQTGAIIGLEYPGPGKLLEAKPGAAGIVDLAYPIPDFGPLRLAARYSTGARVEKATDAVTIAWDRLGASRSFFKMAGQVSGKVWLKALPDGRSVSLQCEIVNGSERSVGQVLFPDLHGLLPFAGSDDTYFRTPGFTRRPFVELQATTYPEFYAYDIASDTRDTVGFSGGGSYGYGNSMVGRWLDYGGLNGGLSLFPKLWIDAPKTNVRLYRLEKDPNVRLMQIHDVTIKPGETWMSAEYVLTPHRQGWAKGIEPYREFVKSQVKRQYPVPRHVRAGLGYRTIFLCKGFPVDGASDIAFHAIDLPNVAREAKEHGLDELVLWFWQEPFTLPAPPPYPHLGTAEEFANAIKQCNELGVNVSLFISILSVKEPTATRYGLKVGPGWTYHPELVPRYNPAYANFRGTRVIQRTDEAFPVWRQDVIASVKEIFARYTRSICWDQSTPHMEDVYREFMPWAKEGDPRATFSGEIVGSAEQSANFLDYTWNWESGSYFMNHMAAYRDDRAFISSFPSPRLNKNINRNAGHIKYYFMDNGYLNVMPSAPDEPNGTAWIRDYPEVSRVLKQCAALRSQFLDYFVDGILIADGLLREPAPDTHIGSYVLPDRVLFMVMNTADEARSVNFSLALEPWLKSSSGKYEVRSYDQQGRKVASTVVGPDWKNQTQELQELDFAIYEFIPQ